jgi:hypothetical protein
MLCEMSTHRPYVFAVVGLAAGLAIACSKTEKHDGVAPDPDVTAVSALLAGATDCAPELRHTHGVAFVRLCPSRDLWISATPVGCSAGEHATVRCPVATPLLAEPERSFEPRAVAVVERESAHRLCAYGFGGRLPSRDERRRARLAQGMATLLASDTSRDGLFLGEVPEWTEDGACSDPAGPGPGCAVDKHPSWFRRGDAIPWDSLRACEATLLVGSPGLAAGIALGDHCADGDCTLRSPLAARPGHPRPLLDLVCKPAGLGGKPHPKGEADVAAVRCVVPASVLDL